MAGRRRPQQRWEYLELSVSYEEEVWMDSAGGRGTFAEALTRTGGAAKWFSSVLLLNGYGAAGWELAGTVAARGGNAAHFFLKRPTAAGRHARRRGRSRAPARRAGASPRRPRPRRPHRRSPPPPPPGPAGARAAERSHRLAAAPEGKERGGRGRLAPRPIRHAGVCVRSSGWWSVAPRKTLGAARRLRPR